MPKQPCSSQRLHTEAINSAHQQSGVLTRSQLLELGFTDAMLRGFLRSRRFGKIAPGIYNTVTGVPSDAALRWAAHLHCGYRSYLYGESALQLWGLGEPTREFVMAVPHGTKRPSLGWIKCVQTRAHREVVRDGELPVEAAADALIDATKSMTDPQEVQNLIADALQKRIVKVPRLKVALNRERVPHRAVFEETIGLAVGGQTTPLEILGHRNVIVAHGLPRGIGQARLEFDSVIQAVDLFYEEYGVVIEFDGRIGHADSEGRFRDMNRDNRVAVHGLITLRFGWSDIRYRPCAAAALIARVLEQRGWLPATKRCTRAHCDVV